MARVTVDEARLAAVGARYGVARLMIFGSVARGTAEPSRDVDVLYELQPWPRPPPPRCRTFLEYEPPAQTAGAPRATGLLSLSGSRTRPLMPMRGRSFADFDAILWSWLWR